MGPIVNFSDTVEKVVGGRLDTFTSSSPCIIPWVSGYLMNIRYVNYKINGGGGYDFKHGDGKITTLNRAVWLRRDLTITKEHWFDAVQDESLRYQGVEDVKIFAEGDGLLYMGTCEGGGALTMGFGSYDFTTNKLISVPQTSPNGRSCEKNWCYFRAADGVRRILYEWSPLTILDTNLRSLSKKDSVPAFFRDVRGSSNGCIVGDEIWFLCHIAHYSTPRHYYHLLVVLDSTTLNFKRHSILFKFHDDCIEYALGLVVETERLLMSYSRMDSTSAVIALPRSVVDAELFPSQKN